MASLVLSQAMGKSFGQFGKSLGGFLGASIDNAIANTLIGTKTEPSRLSSLKLMSSIDGAPMPKIFGRARISGQIIWASEFKESKIKRRIGGKTGPKISQNVYSISLAIGLCEGEINGIGRVWANGKLFDVSQTQFSIHFGGDNQDYDPLIEAQMGAQNCPRFNNTAYIVFEDLLLEEFGDRIPQFSFEVFAKSQSDDSLSNLINGVCLIPASGEFAYSTIVEREILAAGKERLINQNQSHQSSDFICSIENLEREIPSARAISLVAAWFGNDLRANNCNISPRIERANKTTLPNEWNVAGLSRQNAQIVTQIDGSPAFGGSINDKSIIEAIKHLKQKEFYITFNPFIMMDIPDNNNLMGFDGNFQPPYPWRGHIGFAPNQLGSANIRQGIDNFYGNINASHFVINNGNVIYNGPNEWSYSRFVLHMAAICKAAGGVDAFLIGSELICLTRAFDENGNFPFIDKLIDLAAQIKSILGASCKVSYSADWTEYGAFYFDGNTYFPLDKLWANSNIDFIAIDYYAPLSDRHENLNLTATQVQENIEGGEAFNYFYQNDENRQSQIKTPIIDNAYNEAWIYRQKDIRNFWLNQHFERINNVKKANPTPWIAKSKPIRFMEFGVPAINKGANTPSAFPDAYSFDAKLPYFSNGARDDFEQYVAINSFLKYWNENNDYSPIYDGDMVDVSKTHIWAWDARPFPAFPILKNVWKDGDNYEKGHWIMGRTNHSDLPQIFEWALNRAGISNYDCSKISGLIDGFLFDGNSSARELIESLMLGFNIQYQNKDGVLVFSNSPIIATAIEFDKLIFAENSFSENFEIENAACDLSLSFINAENEYEIANIIVENSETSQTEIALPIICGIENGRIIARNIAAQFNSINSNYEISLPLSTALNFEIGDIIKFDNKEIEINSIEWGSHVKMGLTRPCSNFSISNTLSLNSGFNAPKVFSKPLLFVLDLPYPFIKKATPQPTIYACQDPFNGPIGIEFDGAIIGTISQSAILAKPKFSMPSGPISQILNFELDIDLIFGSTIPNNGNFACIENGKIIDIFSYSTIKLIGANQFRIGKILRGLNGISFAPQISNDCELLLLDIGATNIDYSAQFHGLDMGLKLLSPNPNPQIEFDYSFKYSALVNKPWSPSHVSLERNESHIKISFLPRGLGEFDNWEFEQSLKNRQFEIIIRHQNGAIAHEAIINDISYNYQTELVDFGEVQAFLDIEISEIGEFGIKGETFREIKAISTL